MRKVYLFLAILMVASLALGACAPTAPAVTEPLPRNLWLRNPW